MITHEGLGDLAIGAVGDQRLVTDTDLLNGNKAPLQSDQSARSKTRRTLEIAGLIIDLGDRIGEADITPGHQPLKVVLKGPHHHEESVLTQP